MSQEFNTYFEEREYNLIDFPTTVLIDSVSCCNLKCSMCVHKDMKRKKSFMDWNLYTKAIDEIAQVNKNVKIWMVFFGDPFVRTKYKPTIFDMVKYAKNKGLTNVVINTNGCLMTRENSVKIVEAGIDGIYIGIDAFSEKTYSENRCGGNYNETVQNVLDLIDVVKKSKTNKPKIHVQFVEMDNNIKEEKDFIEFWTSKGVNVKVRPMVTWAGKINRKVKTETIKNRKPCSWAMNCLVVSDTGDIANCACDLDVSHSFGNLHKKTIEEIWNTTMKEFRIAHLEHRWSDTSELCINCRDWQSSGEKHYPPKNIS